MKERHEISLVIGPCSPKAAQEVLEAAVAAIEDLPDLDLTATVRPLEAAGNQGVPAPVGSQGAPDGPKVFRGPDPRSKGPAKEPAKRRR